MTVATLSFTRSLPVKQMGHRHYDFASTGTSKGVITTVVVCPSCPTCSLMLSVSSQCLSEAAAWSAVTVQQSLHPHLVQHVFRNIMTPKAITLAVWPDKTLRDTHWKNMAFSSYLSDYDLFLFELLHCMQSDALEIQKAQWVHNALLKAGWIARPKGWWSVVWRLFGGQ